MTTWKNIYSGNLNIKEAIENGYDRMVKTAEDGIFFVKPNVDVQAYSNFTMGHIDSGRYQILTWIIGVSKL
tara:strand:- start:5710 stop:5922 length:213 start_codon:yes stop_codon:yes gene_type:complete